MAKTSRQVAGVGFIFLLKKSPNKALHAEPPIVRFLNSTTIAAAG